MKNGIEYVMQRGRQGMGAQGAIGGLGNLQSQAEASAQSLAGLRQALDQLAQGNYATQRGNAVAISLAASQLGGNGTGNVYGEEVALANDAKTKIVGIEQEKVAQVKVLNEAQRQSNAELYNELEMAGENAERKFASGLSRTFISIVDGSKSAEQAFEAFAKSFLEQIAQMIMQTLILNALKSVSLFGGGGQVMAGGASGDANGGMHAAAAGVMLAAAGMQGVAEVNGATYLPRFNVLAGEAGREILTVMARPQLTSVDGLPVMLGEVGPEKLAILSQQSLSRMIQGAGRTMLAAGGVISGNGGLSPAMGLGISGPSAGGKVDITIRLEAGLKAEIVQQSVEGARIQVATDLQTDSPIRSGVKGVLA